MNDPRVLELARTAIHKACRIQPGENVFIENTGCEIPFVQALIDEVYKAQGHPFVRIRELPIERALAIQPDPVQRDLEARHRADFMRDMNVHIRLQSCRNAFEMTDVPVEPLVPKSEKKEKTKVKPRFLTMRWPSPAIAQKSGMSTEAFENYFFQVCDLNYELMCNAMNPLMARMNAADEVHIVGDGTDLRFSIRDIPAVKCSGNLNLPDGEIFTSPVRNSVNGTVHYNVSSTLNGFHFENIQFIFKEGRIMEACCNDTVRLNRVLDTDEGARYIGEFALGLNPYITRPVNETLFDEKLTGSFHLAPGNCYKECSNGNHSSLHWDLVCLQTKEYGGGEIFFDGELIRRDGLFLPDDLQGLNPENLKRYLCSV